MLIVYIKSAYRTIAPLEHFNLLYLDVKSRYQAGDLEQDLIVLKPVLQNYYPFKRRIPLRPQPKSKALNPFHSE